MFYVNVEFPLFLQKVVSTPRRWLEKYVFMQIKKVMPVYRYALIEQLLKESEETKDTESGGSKISHHLPVRLWWENVCLPVYKNQR